MIRLALEQTGCKPEETLMVGDRLYTDIACGVNAGVDTVLVLTGEATAQDAAKVTRRPHWCAGTWESCWRGCGKRGMRWPKRQRLGEHREGSD